MTQRLVSPDRVLHILAFRDEDRLKALQEQYEFTPEVARNLRQLLGWTEVGNGRGDKNDRTGRKEAANWQMLSEVNWLKHDDGAEIVPLVGKPTHKFDSMVAPPAKMKFSRGSMRNLLNGAIAHAGGWRVVSPPLEIFTLRDGASLVGFPAAKVRGGLELSRRYWALLT